MALYLAVSLNSVQWLSLKTQIHNYFGPAYFLHCAQDELAAIKQTGRANGYIDPFKRICSRIASISDDEMIDHSIHSP